MSELNIDVVTPKGIKFSGEAISCTAPGWDGEFQILKDHTSMVTQLKVGSVIFDNKGKKKIMATSGGYLEVQNNNISIIAETAEWADEIELERAREAERRARKRLDSHDGGLDIDRVKVSLARALNRIKVASRV
jgi:F-type H+-transporting ATPase subunit epsilon